jgi:hypothetical protein
VLCDATPQSVFKTQRWMLLLMRKPITMRFDTDLLALAKLKAACENRTLTNFIETVVREHVTEITLTIDTSNASATASSPMPGPEAGGDS